MHRYDPEACDSPVGEAIGRHQAGYVSESKSGAFHVRYYTTEIVDGQPKRIQKSHLLCRKNNRYYSRTCKEVKNKRDEFMRTINISDVSDADMLVIDFWEQRHLPFVTENMKPSTISGYKQI